MDGDLCNDAQETVISQASHDNLHVWGKDKGNPMQGLGTDNPCFRT